MTVANSRLVAGIVPSTTTITIAITTSTATIITLATALPFPDFAPDFSLPVIVALPTAPVVYAVLVVVDTVQVLGLGE